MHREGPADSNGLRSYLAVTLPRVNEVNRTLVYDPAQVQRTQPGSSQVGGVL